MTRLPFLITIALLTLANFLQAQQHPPLQPLDIFELEWASDPQISPDGKRVVYLRNGMDIMKDKRVKSLWIINTDGTNHQKLTSAFGNEANPRWSPDGTRLAFTASTRNDGSELFLYWANTGTIAKISQLPASPNGLNWSPDGQWIAFSMFVEGKEKKLWEAPKKPKGAEWGKAPTVTTRFKHEADGSGKMKPGFSHLFLIPADGGTPRQLTSGNFNHASSPIWSKDGNTLFFSSNRKDKWEYDFRNSEIYALQLADTSIVALTDRDGPDHSISRGKDGKTLAYAGFSDKRQTYQNQRLYTMNTDGSNRKEWTTDIDISIYAPQADPAGNGIYYLFDEKGNTKIGYIDAARKHAVVASNVGGTSIGRPYPSGSFSVSQNGVIAFTHTTPDHPAELAIIRRGDRSPRLITFLNGDLLGQRTLGKTEEIWYKSSFDKRDIQGWVVTPPNYDPNKVYPLLVENHGGPILNYGDRFTPEIQLYAAAGYVVFYPNPRGSTSYGEEFANLLYHNYPGEDYQDVMDGVDVLVKKGVVSEDSLYVTGGSAGGIMTAWIIGKTNRFRAAAVIKPVMNWISKTLTADNYYGYAHTRYPGQPWENPMDYWKFSPISLVGNVQTPTLVMVGLDDLRTPPSEAKQLYHALKLREVETALVEIPGASHFIARRPSHLMAKVGYILGWFEEYR